MFSLSFQWLMFNLFSPNHPSMYKMPRSITTARPSQVELRFIKGIIVSGMSSVEKRKRKRKRKLVRRNSCRATRTKEVVEIH